MYDADALMKEFADFVRPSNNSDFADIPTWNDAVSLVGSMPIIEERKTGKWIREEKHYKDSEQEYYYYEEHCSVCGARRKIGWAEANYCPNCGADMRGVKDDNN